MNDKERLQEIKRNREFPQYGTDEYGNEEIYYLVISHEFEWLIEQAEKVEQLQKENEKLFDQKESMWKTIDYQQKQLQQAQQEIERLKSYNTNNFISFEANRTIREQAEMITKLEQQLQQAQQEIERLVKQRDELELETNDWRAEVQKWQKFYKESEESHLETKELLKNIVNQNKRYRVALENICVSPFRLDIDEAVTIAKQALEGKENE
jgi:multidrug resistance efflux pump